MPKIEETQFVLAGRDGYIGSLIFDALVAFSKRPVITLSRADFQTIPNFVIGEQAVVINAVGITESLQSTNTKMIAELNLANVQTVERLISVFDGRVEQFIHISSSLLSEHLIVEKSEYAKSKLRAEKLIDSMREQTQTSFKTLRLPSIWSSRTAKANSLLEFFRQSSFPFDPNLLRNGDQICHIAPEETLFNMLKRAIQGDENLVTPLRHEFYRGTAKSILSLLNQTKLASANSEIERALYKFVRT